jgi:hypothetical protein
METIACGDVTTELSGIVEKSDFVPEIPFSLICFWVKGFLALFRSGDIDWMLGACVAWDNCS